MKKTKEELWNEIRNRSKYVEMQMNQLSRKRTGSYYTDLILTDVMMQELIEHLSEQQLVEYKFLEPCVGTGNFVFSYLRAIDKLNVEPCQFPKILSNIYVADINEVALFEYKNLLTEFADVYWGITLDDEYFESHIIPKGLLLDVSAKTLNYIGLQDVQALKLASHRFDIIATNPPYKNLKAERNQYDNIKDYDIDKEKYSSIAKLVKRHFQYATEGVLNLYKLFVEEIVDKYGTDEAFVSLLIPASFLSDKTCKKIRTHLLLDNNIISVKVIGEGSGYIDAQQALCTILLQKGSKTKTISMTKDFCNQPKNQVEISINDILNESTGNSIMMVDSNEYEILRKLRTFPTVKNLNFITNMRGELDITADKEFITSTPTGIPMLRGRNIGHYRLIDTTNDQFVKKEFLNKTKKIAYVLQDRIACQQIANMHKERRVTFSLVPRKHVLANSCNFLAVAENKYGIDVYTLLGLFNTKIINWLFKLTSSNNHINNYEIDCFPVPVDSLILKRISHLVRIYVNDMDETIMAEIEKCAEIAYGIKNMGKEYNLNLFEKFYVDISYILPDLTMETAAQIFNGNLSAYNFSLLSSFMYNVANGIIEKYLKIKSNHILNHTTFKLSDLDLEMIKAVPPGGNWKDIPHATVAKSGRLKKIAEKGGRTTLYGRIDYDKPSYTISTYFNRPGNGTYVHPAHERVLSIREAARLQCFADDYYFFGNKTQVLKQVGNAVPTVLAYQIGRKITEALGEIRSIDLFCGAGGMTAGFKGAGIKSILSNDIEESACTTLKINNPEINVLCGDITNEQIKQQIVDVAIAEKADVICGGPPCQGFSMAGLRLTDDPRNRLFKDFIDIVGRIKPKIVVLENVEGLLSYQNGKVYQAIHSMFADIGYKTEGKVLMASEYAVPQKRKRVIIICVRNDIEILPESLFPVQLTKENERQITARETISDLENVPCSDEAVYSMLSCSNIGKLLRHEITYKQYVDIYSER